MSCKAQAHLRSTFSEAEPLFAVVVAFQTQTHTMAKGGCLFANSISFIVLPLLALSHFVPEF